MLSNIPNTGSAAIPIYPIIPNPAAIEINPAPTINNGPATAPNVASLSTIPSIFASLNIEAIAAGISANPNTNNAAAPA